jgi:hypothetical protein
MSASPRPAPTNLGERGEGGKEGERQGGRTNCLGKEGEIVFKAAEETIEQTASVKGKVQCNDFYKEKRCYIGLKAAVMNKRQFELHTWKNGEPCYPSELPLYQSLMKRWGNLH